MSLSKEQRGKSFPALALQTGVDDGNRVQTITRKVTLTNAQIKAMRATPVTLVAAPGANKVNQLVAMNMRLNAGANVLTESADNMAVKYVDGSGVAVSDAVEATGFIDQAADTYTSGVPVTDAIVAASANVNKALVLHNTGDGEYAGNAAADATMDVWITYNILDVS